MNADASMMVCDTGFRTCTKSILSLSGNMQRQMRNRVYGSVLRLPSCSYYFSSRLSRLHYTSMGSLRSKRISCLKGSPQFQSNFSGYCRARDMTSGISLAFKSIIGPRCYRKTCINLSTASHDMNLRILGQTRASTLIFNTGPISGNERCIHAGIVMGLLVCFSMTRSSYAEAHEGDSSSCSSHGKKVLSDYSVIGIPGDGRCLFRSVAHGAGVRSGKPAPNESFQKELADELRARVADEFVKRREETEWFIEGDFETYVSQIRRSHVWGGEPELLMASHVLQMPITVYMHDQESSGLISIAEYGQEYGKNNPIKILYHGYGHYDALHIPHEGGARPRL